MANSQAANSSVQGSAAVVLLWFLALYRSTVSPHLKTNCRFEMSCSAYMVAAVAKHGAIRGLLRGTRRLFSCHPWSNRPYWDAP